MAGALFITGNKRSGTSQLARLLNLHPKIFISHESDIIWILYQFHNNRAFAPYPWDSARGMEYTLNEYGHILRKDTSPVENFFALQQHLMEGGSPWLTPMKKKDLLWVGDKKPFQYSDPVLIEFIHGFFSKVAFIHLIRHPFAVAFSAERFNRTPNGDFWKGMTLEEMVERWGQHENCVLQLKQSKWAQVLDVRYEDLCRYTENELSRIFGFLDLESDKNILKRASRNTRYPIRKMPKIPCSKEVCSIMKLYGYNPEGAVKSDWEVFFTNIYWSIRKKFGYPI